MNYSEHVLFVSNSLLMVLYITSEVYSPKMGNDICIYVYAYISFGFVGGVLVETLFFDFLDIFRNHQLDVHFSPCYHSFASITTYTLHIYSLVLFVLLEY